MRADLIGTDAGTLVVDPELDLARPAPQPHRDGRAGRRERCGIVHQIAHHLAEAVVVAENGERLLERRRAAAPSSSRISGALSFLVSLAEIHERAQELLQIDRLRLGTGKLGVEARGIGNVGDQPVEAADIVLDDAVEAIALLVGPGILAGSRPRCAARSGVLELMDTSAAKASMASMRL